MKAIMETYNRIVNSIFEIDKEIRCKELEISNAEQEIARLQRLVKSHKNAILQLEEAKCEQEEAAGIAMTELKEEHAASLPVTDAPSEYYARRFSEDILPHLNEWS